MLSLEHGALPEKALLPYSGRFARSYPRDQAAHRQSQEVEEVRMAQGIRFDGASGIGPESQQALPRIL